MKVTWIPRGTPRELRPSGTWPKKLLVSILAGSPTSGLGNLTSHHQVHLSDGQAQDVEDASVGKVEGPDNRLAMVGGWGGVGRVEENPVLAQQGIQLFTQTSSSPSL